MRFIPHTTADVAHMLETIGAGRIDDLFAPIPPRIRERARLNLPRGLGEREVAAALGALAAENQPLGTFQGAGAYNHYVPAAVAQILSRSEFATAYTPYQPEVSQGTLQAAFEFQTYVAILTGLDVANASLYDGASALAEAVLMALRLRPGRDRILISRGIHPEYHRVVLTYLRGADRGRVEEIALGADGATDLTALGAAVDEDVAVVCVGYPNFFGVIDDLEGVARVARGCGALTISATSEALALALLRAPGDCGADVAVAEGQSLGLPLSYGGPGVGLFATRKDFVRQTPGRLVGQTVDERNGRGFVLTLATREQHIRREKATSNICTNQGLAALAVTVFLGLAGRSGLRALAEENATCAHDVRGRLTTEARLSPVFSAPFFNEFVVEEPPGDGWFADALARGVVPGVRLGKLLPTDRWAQGKLLVAVTECNSPDQVDALVRSLAARRAA